MSIKTIKSYFIIYLTLIFLNSINLISQYDYRNIRFKKFTPENGLTGTEIKDIVQDSLGFIWIGTNEGLIRFDGYEFKTIVDTNYASAFPIFCMTIDFKGRIWIGSRVRGLAIYDPKSESFTYYKHDKKDSLSLGANDVTALHTDENGTIWIATGRYINKFDEKNNAFIRFNKNNLPGLSFHLISDKKRNLIWIPTLNHGLISMNRKTGVFTEYRVEQYDEHLTSCSFYDENTLIVGSREGLLIFDITQGAFIKHYKHNPTDPCSISGDEMFLSKVWVDKNKNVWVGTNHDGLNIFDIRKECFYAFKLNEANPYSINNNHIRKIFEDKDGLIWIGTSDGIGLYNPALHNLKVYFHAFGEKPDIVLSGNNISALFEDSQKQIWVGTFGKGLNLIKNDGKVEHFINIQGKKGELLSNDVHSISEDDYGRIWIFNPFNVPKSIYIPEEKKFYDLYNYLSIPEFIKKYNTEVENVVLKGKNGMMWLGGHNFHGYDIYKKELVMFDQDLPDSLRNKIRYISNLLEDKESNVWLGSFVNGLIKYSPKQNKFEFFSHNEDNKISISSNNITALTEDETGCIWIGTRYGLNVYNPRTRTFTRLFEKDGLSGNQINALAYNGKDKIWIGTNKGLTCLNLKNKTFRNFSVSDGLPTNEINSLLYAGSGQLYVGTRRGLLIFNPDKYITNSISSSVRLTGLTVFNKKKSFNKSVSYLNEIELNYDESLFTVNFSSFNFYAPEKTEFSYKLDGFSKQWIHIGNKHSIMFSGLNPGKYVLWIKYSNEDNQWSEEHKLLVINIIPPWWQTRWFYFLVITLILFGIYLFIKFRERSLRARKIFLEKQVAEATRKITEEKEKLFQANKIITEQKKIVDEKNKNILDSIQYAKRIQNAILPSDIKWKTILSNSFIIYLPKDIVAGDFYWLEVTDDYIFMAIADCTGHGVPGAMVSVVCSHALTRCVMEMNLTETHRILDKTRELVIEQFSKNQDNVNDGMDISLVRFDKNNHRNIQFSGANIPLYIILLNRDNIEIQIVQADKQPIGKFEKSFPFTSQNIKISSESMLYLCTDGFSDQFGGQKGKKLGTKKLKEILTSIQHLPLNEQKQELLSIYYEWKSSEEQTDDITIAGIKIL